MEIKEIEVEVGTVYTAYRQGTAITPQTRRVIVVWLDGDTVHYRKMGDSRVEQTTLTRFSEIINPEFVKGAAK